MADRTQETSPERAADTEGEAALLARIEDLELKLHRNRREVRRLRQALADAEVAPPPPPRFDESDSELTVEALKMLHAKIKRVA